MRKHSSRRLLTKSDFFHGWLLPFITHGGSSLSSLSSFSVDQVMTMLIRILEWWRVSRWRGSNSLIAPSSLQTKFLKGWRLWWWNSSQRHSLGGQRSLRRANWSLFKGAICLHGNLLQSNFCLVSGVDISSVYSIDLFTCVLVNEVYNVHESSSNTHKKVVALFNFDVDSLLAELVDTLGLTKEHDFHFLSLRILVKETT